MMSVDIAQFKLPFSSYIGGYDVNIRMCGTHKKPQTVNLCDLLSMHHIRQHDPGLKKSYLARLTCAKLVSNNSEGKLFLTNKSGKICIDLVTNEKHFQAEIREFKLKLGGKVKLKTTSECQVKIVLRLE